ncbi:MAG: CehA/McbA family metallohydrolase [Xanthomonadales bacterium]|nr:CehA/McbA family metallohydrolase [Xanthomonadales bacterium]
MKHLLFALLLSLYTQVLWAHDSIWQVVPGTNEYAGRPYTDPETGYTFVDADGRRILNWKPEDKNISAVRVTDIDLTGNLPIGNWGGLGHVETRDSWQVLVGGSFVFDYDDAVTYDTDADGVVEVLVDADGTDEFYLRYDHIAMEPADVVQKVDRSKGKYQWITFPFKNARFTNRLYGGGDFALFARGAVYPPNPKFKTGIVVLDIRVTIEKENKPQNTNKGTLTLVVTDGESGEQTPARFGIYAVNSGWSPEPSKDAIWFYRSTVPIRQATMRTAFDEGKNWPGKGTWVSYLDGKYTAEMPEGEYQVVIYKGPEYRIENRTLAVRAGKTTSSKFDLKRWSHEAKEGWYPGDLHLHIDRFDNRDNVNVGKLLQAEGLSLGVDLQIMYDQIFVYHQIYGDNGRHMQGGDMKNDASLIVPGQETPRGSQWGHFEAIDVSKFHRPRNYMAPHESLPVFRNDNAVVGINHVMLDLFHASSGIFMNEFIDGFDYMEILQFSVLGPQLMYDVLNLGYKVAPTAGTDYPALGFIGQERTYVHVPGTFSRDAWKDAIRKGNVFVSNGPLIDFSINGKGMGEEFAVKKGETLSIKAHVSINPDIDALDRIELIRYGDVIETVTAGPGIYELSLSSEEKADAGAWYAVRVYGKRTAKAHSGIIYTTVEGKPGFWSSEKAPFIVENGIKIIDRAMAKPNLEDIRIWGTGGRLKQMWEEALPANQKRAAEAKAALNERLKLIQEN